jgi:hypothetical protein
MRPGELAPTQRPNIYYLAIFAISDRRPFENEMQKPDQHKFYEAN